MVIRIPKVFKFPSQKPPQLTPETSLKPEYVPKVRMSSNMYQVGSFDVVAEGRKVTFEKGIIDSGCDSGIAVSVNVFRKIMTHGSVYMEISNDMEKTTRMGLCRVTISDLGIENVETTIIGESHLDDTDVVIGRFMILDSLCIVMNGCNNQPKQFVVDDQLIVVQPGEFKVLNSNPVITEQSKDAIIQCIQDNNSRATNMYKESNYFAAAHLFCYCYIMGRFAHPHNSDLLAGCCYKIARSFQNCGQQENAVLFCKKTIGYDANHKGALVLWEFLNEIIE